MLNNFLFLFANKMLVIRAGSHKMHACIANNEDPDQTASSEAVLPGSSMFCLCIFGRQPGHEVQLVMCLPTDVSLTAVPRVRSWSHTFVEIDHEIISTVILLPSAESFKKGCCQLQAKVCARSTD